MDSGISQLVPLLLHYDGTRWASVTPPKLASAAGLRGITALSERDIWAVGWLSNPAAQASVPLVLHFDGTVWRQVEFPAVPGSSASLNKVAATGPAGVYAVGGGQSAGTLVMESPGGSPVVARWDGHARMLLPLSGIPAEAELRDVAVAGSDVWVVGDRADASGPIEGLAWRWHAGGGWTSYRPDPHPWGVLNGVHAASAREVWAAGTPGSDGTGDGVLLTRWDGQRWKPAFRIPAVPALRGLADVTTAGGTSSPSAAHPRHSLFRTDAIQRPRPVGQRWSPRGEWGRQVEQPRVRSSLPRSITACRTSAARQLAGFRAAVQERAVQLHGATVGGGLPARPHRGDTPAVDCPVSRN
jgi:hypothetical protein